MSHCYQLLIVPPTAVVLGVEGYKGNRGGEALTRVCSRLPSTRGGAGNSIQQHDRARTYYFLKPKIHSKKTYFIIFNRNKVHNFYILNFETRFQFI